MPPEGSSGMQNDEGSLERLRNRLYSQQAPNSFNELSLPVRHEEIPQSHQPVTAWTPPPLPKPKKKISLAIIFLGGAVAFFVIAGIISLLFLLQGGRTVSNANISITVQGPTTIASGTAVPLVLTIKNSNPAAIIGAKIELNFPDGTRSADDVTQALPRYSNTFDSIGAGASVNSTAQAVLFGSANQTVTIPITFEYHTANSNALFTKTQNYTFTITSSPLSITANTIANVPPGQPFTISLSVRSNASAPLSNIAVAAVYPTGFTAQSVQVNGKVVPASSSLLMLGAFVPGQESSITIKGTLAGTESDLKDFQFTVGTPKTDGSSNLGVAYASETIPVTLSKAFLAATLSLNHDDGSTTQPIAVPSGEPISGAVSWTNSLSSIITNGIVTVKFLGNALDPASVQVQDGFYNSSTNSIIFNSQNQPGLASLNPGDTGIGSFSFSTKANSALNALRTPTIQLAISVAGQTSSGAQVITDTLTRTVQIATDLELSSKIVHAIGPFTNSGVLPPVANQLTQYTVELGVTNTINDVAGATATMILPSYVSYTGNVTPSDGSVIYDDTTRTVTWKTGSVPAGTVSKPLTAAFQISFTPSISQQGSSPILVGNQNLVGTDRFTHAQVGNVAPALTTEITADPTYKPSFGTVAN